MTYSIQARDPETGDFGAAAATGNLCVGGFVPHLAAAVGAIATLGYSVSPLYGAKGLRLLEEGLSAEAVCRKLSGEDSGAARRQLTVLDAQGRSAGWTGAENIDVKVHRCRENLAVAVNWVTSDAVAVAIEESYLTHPGLPMAERLLTALAAGYATGGDARGALSAALKIASADHALIDLRVDYHETDPIGRLRQLYERTLDPDYRAFFQRLPCLNDPQRA